MAPALRQSGSSRAPSSRIRPTTRPASTRGRGGVSSANAECPAKNTAQLRTAQKKERFSGFSSLELRRARARRLPQVEIERTEAGALFAEPGHQAVESLLSPDRLEQRIGLEEAVAGEPVVRGVLEPPQCFFSFPEQGMDAGDVVLGMVVVDEGLLVLDRELDLLTRPHRVALESGDDPAKGIEQDVVGELARSPLQNRRGFGQPAEPYEAVRDLVVDPGGWCVGGGLFGHPQSPLVVTQVIVRETAVDQRHAVRGVDGHRGFGSDQRLLEQRYVIEHDRQTVVRFRQIWSPRDRRNQLAHRAGEVEPAARSPEERTTEITALGQLRVDRE